MKGIRGWASLDGSFWWGGITAINSIRNLDTKQTSSRIGATVSLPYSKHQSIKVAYSNGAYIRFGGNYQNVSVAWQYSWLGSPNKYRVADSDCEIAISNVIPAETARSD